jgi:hypothetical protein
MATYTQLLALYDTAIQNLLTGEHESYSIGNRTVTRLDLADLQEQRNNIAIFAARESGGSVRVAKMQRVTK